MPLPRPSRLLTATFTASLSFALPLANAQEDQKPSKPAPKKSTSSKTSPAAKRATPARSAIRPITFSKVTGAPTRTKAAVSRAGGEPIELVALTPEAYGLSISEQPSLFWYQSDRSPARGLRFSLYEDGAHEEIITARLPVSYDKGINRLDLKNLRVRLDPGKTYRWSVTYVTSARSGSANAVTKAMLKVDAPSPELGGKLATATGDERIAALAEAGAWHDLLVELDELAKTPSPAAAASARSERAKLLESVGIGPLGL